MRKGSRQFQVSSFRFQVHPPNLKLPRFPTPDSFFAALPLRCAERLSLSVEPEGIFRGSASVFAQGAAFRRFEERCRGGGAAKKLGSEINNRLFAHHGGGAAKKLGSEINNRLSAQILNTH
jgi:hypothetical protein